MVELDSLIFDGLRFGALLAFTAFGTGYIISFIFRLVIKK